MTPDELREKLRSLGIDPENPQWGKSRASDLGKLPIIQHQRDSLAQVKKLLEAQVASDQSEILRLREQLSRLKRGGGL